MATIQEIRQKYPGAYDDLSDQQLADRLYDRHYSDMLRSDFDAKVGLLKTPQELQPSTPMEQIKPAAYRPPAAQQGNPAVKRPAAQRQPSGQLQGDDWWTGLAGQVAQGPTLGYGDEIIAGLYAGLGVNDYQENLRRIQGLDKQFVQENPVTSFAANVAGGLPIGGAVAKGGQGLLSIVAPNAARAVGAGTASAGQRIAAGSATGIGAGTVAGFGSGEGGVEDRASNAVTGGLLGGSLGAALPAAMSAASGAGSAVMRTMPWLRDINVAGVRPFTSADERATQIIGQTMARGGDQGAAEQALSGAVKSQITKPTGAVNDTVLGDVSPELRSLTGVVLRSPGAGAAKAREFVATRQEGIPLANVPGQGSRLAGEVSNVGGKINLRDTLDAIVEERSAAAKPLFEKAFEVGDVVNPTLASVAQDGAIQRALAKGVVLGKRAGDIPQDFKLALKDPAQPIPARVWHYAKTALDDQISTLRQAGKGAEARSAQILKANLVNGLDEATGGNYRPALADFAGRSALLDAAEQGQKAITSSVGPDDIQRTLAGFETQGERDLFAQAYKSVLANQMANSSRTTNAANKALLTDQQVAKIRAVFPPDQAEEIIRRASVRDAQFRTYAETKGSQTQARQMAEQDVEGSIQGGFNIAGAVANPKGYLIGRAMEWLGTMPGRAMSEKVRNALARQLVDPDPKKVANALQAVQAAADRSVTRGKTITGNRQFIGQAAGQTAANNTLNPGISGLAQMYSGAWDNGDAIDRAAMAAAPVPVAGDIASVANDVRNFASGKTPMTAANIGMAALGALPFVPGIAGAVGKGAAKAADEGIIAYHGSPHTFDKFDMSKIGTGEGAQAYGHGLYFAGNEGVARSYRDNLGKSALPQVVASGKDIPKGTWAASMLRTLHDDARFYNFEEAKNRALSDLDFILKREQSRGNVAMVREVQDAIDAVSRVKSKSDLELRRGSMYQVRLNVKPDELLDWDKPLSQQPKRVQNIMRGTIKKEITPESLAAEGYANPSDAMKQYWQDPSGNNFYRNAPLSGAQDAASRSAALKAAGIKGIRYLDGSSRKSGQGSYNYVIFDDKLIDILKRYGIPITIGAGGSAMVLGSDMPEEIKAQMGGA